MASSTCRVSSSGSERRAPQAASSESTCVGMAGRAGSQGLGDMRQRRVA